MSWSDFSANDAVGASLEGLGHKIEQFALTMKEAANQMAERATTAQQRGEIWRAAWQNLDAVTASAYSSLNDLDISKLHVDIASRVEASKHELARARTLLENSVQTHALANNLGVFGKNLGAAFSAAEVLWTIKNPRATTFEFGESATGAIFGFIAGGIAALFSASLAGVVFLGVGAGFAAREAWSWLAPQIGLSPDDSPLFWDTLFDQLGLGPDLQTDRVAGSFNTAKRWTPPRDPLILDLDGDGIETVGLTSNVFFDHDGDRILTRTGWAGRDDALLVWDRNANGTIDSGAELFGDFTPLPNGALAPNGFAALAALDANGDGVIDARDPAFDHLQLWRDASQDGTSQGGELTSLDEAGITSLQLAHNLKNQSLSNGNTLAREGRFTRADGATGGMGEFHLATDTLNTKFAEAIEVPDALKALPTMQGAGNVRELRQAAAMSERAETSRCSWRSYRTNRQVLRPDVADFAKRNRHAAGLKLALSKQPLL